MYRTPLISVAMATYNGSNFIEEQLDSILSQTYKNIEIVIVDDCSTDNTMEILSQYKLKHPCIRVFRNERNINVNQTFNRALGLCRGELIAISDQDDIWISNKLEEAYSSIGKYSMVYSNSLLVNEYGGLLGRRMFKKHDLYTGNDPRSVSIFNNVAGHTIIFKSEILKDILPIPQHSHYDWWIAFVAANRKGLMYMKNPYAMHRIHSNNVSKGIKCISQEDGLVALKKWTYTMLSVTNIRHEQFFHELQSIQNINNSNLKKLCLLIFQLKYSKVIFYNNKKIFSRLNRARKLNLPHIPN